MVRRDVQQLEVVLVGLDLGPLEDLEAVGVEDLAQVAHEGHHRVEVTDWHRPARRAHVEGLGGRVCVSLRARQLGLARLDGGFQLAPDGVGELPELGAILGRDGSELLEEQRDAPGAAEELVAKGRESLGVRRRRDARRGIGPEALEIGSEVGHAALTSSGKTNDPAPESGRGRE